MAYGRLLDRTGRLRGDLNRAQIRLVHYLAGTDEDLGRQGREDFLKDLLLIVNPSLYNDVYDEHGNPKFKEEEIDYEVPQSEADVERMLEEMKRMGVKL
jgi:hypothetical protein